MQSPVEERKESVMVNMCLDSKKKKKGGERRVWGWQFKAKT